MHGPPPPQDPGQALATIHLDLDGARHIYRAHGWSYDHADDPIFETGLRGALDLFARARVSATLFVVAEDVFDPRKRALLDEALAAGHEIASHSFTHPRLTTLTRAGKQHEIAESRSCLQSTLDTAVHGFRAPGFHIDDECLELISEAGYAYDSSVMAARQPTAAPPVRSLPRTTLAEVWVPSVRPFSLPFHPSYSLVLGDWYFRAGLRDYCGRGLPFVLLFHLTDFADPLPAHRARRWRQRLFTLSYLSAREKHARCRAMLDLVQRHFAVGSTTTLLRDHP